MAKTYDTPDKIVSLVQMPTGRLILATEHRIYEMVNNVWEPMWFTTEEDAEPTPEPAPTPTETPSAPAA